MAENTKIGWCDHTINFWWGCTKVSPACAFCYADFTDRRWGGGHWGDSAPRRMIKSARPDALKFNRKAKAAGQPALVFCMSMGDIFEDKPGSLVVDHNGELAPPDYRTLDHLRRNLVWPTIRKTPWLRWLLLTKRPENIPRMLPADLVGAPNVWLGTTVESPDYLSRIEPLVSVPAPVHFVSAEPLIRRTDFHPHISPEGVCTECGHWNPTTLGICVGCGAEDRVMSSRVNWLIVGGESKQCESHNPRPFNLRWANDCTARAALRRIPVYVKQLGNNPYFCHMEHKKTASRPEWGEDCGGKADDPCTPLFVTDKGADPSEWPNELRVQQRPVF